MDGPSCAGTAHWDIACIAIVAIYAKAVTQGTMTSPMTLPKKFVLSSEPEIQARMQPGGGEGSPGKKLKLEPAAQA